MARRRLDRHLLRQDAERQRDGVQLAVTLQLPLDTVGVQRRIGLQPNAVRPFCHQLDMGQPMAAHLVRRLEDQGGPAMVGYAP